MALGHSNETALVTSLLYKIAHGRGQRLSNGGFHRRWPTMKNQIFCVTYLLVRAATFILI